MAFYLFFGFKCAYIFASFDLQPAGNVDFIVLILIWYAKQVKNDKVIDGHPLFRRICGIFEQ